MVKIRRVFKLMIIIKCSPPIKSLLRSIKLKTHLKGLQEMLERGVWWSGRETKGNLAATYKHLMFWALWDTASFCIDNRLKTPLGSNKDTLSSIDKAIRNFDRQLRWVFKWMFFHRFLIGEPVRYWQYHYETPTKCKTIKIGRIKWASFNFAFTASDAH